MNPLRTSLPLLLGAATLALGAASGVGCSSTTVEPELGVVRAELVRAQTCDDLLLLLKADARVRMNRYIDLTIASLEAQDDQGSLWGSSEEAAAGDDGGDLAGEGSSGTGGNTDGSAPPRHSETNTQVEGVDEADIVKTDGFQMYVLHGPSLTTLKSWPVEELGLESSAQVEGSPIEMYVADGKAVVYSNVDGTPIYEALGKEPRRDEYYGGYYGEGDAYYEPYAPLTKVTVFDMTGEAPTVVSESYSEGYYVSSRRDGAHVRTILSGGAHEGVVRYYPEYAGDDYPEDADEWIDAYEVLREENERRIAAATLADFLPDRFERRNGQFAEVGPSCADAFVPTPGSTDFGLTSVQSLDLAALDQPAHESLVFGATQTVYANLDKLVLAGSSWGSDFGLFWGIEMPEDPVSITGTHLHVFDLASNPSEPRYIDSGTVLGTLTDQFAIDERDGVLRVATTETIVSADTWTSMNGVATLAVSGNEVSSLGELRGLAPGESIYATRFLGDRGYIVTFRQVDPLFVIDFSTPAAPELLGELKIPGFSEYMHPLEDDKHLLTIGFDGTDTGEITGLALQIFDVTDPTAPKQTHKELLSSAWSGWSEALYNHKAFTLYDGMLAIPVEGYDDVNGTYGSELRLFEVSNAEGITPIGTIDHSPYFANAEASYCYYGYGVRRGVFIEDYLYSVSEGAVVASSVSNPSVAVSAVELPSIEETYCGYYY